MTYKCHPNNHLKDSVLYEQGVIIEH